MPQQLGVMIEPRTELAAGLPVIQGIASEVREALINLVFNATDAMPEGGILTLRTRIIEAGTNRAGHTVPRRVCIEVVDSGVGMDEETQRRCLEPFFTTKGERGTGLGLAMVYGVAQRHGADIEIDSAAGQGTTMRLAFPIPVTAPTDAVVAKVYAVPIRQRILVVDDDPVLLKSLSDILDADGHVVTAANLGQAGIDAFRTALASSAPYDVVITDLGMPYVDGRKVARSVKEASPTTPVILLTGWGQRLIAEGDIPPHVDCVLSKPPKLDELRGALARHRPRSTPPFT
jgi:CheY-like chemotaxis protein